MHEGKISMEHEVNKEKPSFYCWLYNTVPRQYYSKQYRHSLYLPQRENNDIAKKIVMFFILILLYDHSVEVDWIISLITGRETSTEYKLGKDFSRIEW